MTLKFDRDEDPVKFNSNSFKDGKTCFLLPSDFEASIANQLGVIATEQQAIAAEKAQQDAERAEHKRTRELALSNFQRLTTKYDVPPRELIEDDLLSPLGGILEKLETNDLVEDGELEWLESRGRELERIDCSGWERVIAIVHYRKFKLDGDLWALVKACKHLRKAKLPEKAIAISDHAHLGDVSDRRLRSAIFTTRGGAFRDLNDLISAKRAAVEAIKASASSFHPHNLLGAILYEEGNPSEGDRSFELALELGATSRGQEFEIKSALKRSNSEARQRVVDYLLQKNPSKYAWVREFAI